MLRNQSVAGISEINNISPVAIFNAMPHRLFFAART